MSESDSEIENGKAEPTHCPFLDTINRAVLDFDMTKVCSVTLSSHNVYCCLVCGKFFEGRGKTTPAFTHSVAASHHVFMNLKDTTVWCLPDGYQVKDASLRDIQFALQPTFSEDYVKHIDSQRALSTDVSGVSYLPGYVGINNLKHTDGISVVIQALAHVAPLRNYFLDRENHAHNASKLVHTFGDLIRRLWNPAAFKSNVTPLEFVNEVTIASNKRFVIGKPVEAAEFLTWLLNTLHGCLTAEDAAAVAVAKAAKIVSGSKRPREESSTKQKRSIITDVFQGELMVTTVSSELEEATAAATVADRIGRPAGKGSSRIIPFLCLSLDLPPAPLFTDATGANVIPQVALYTLLSKYDGTYITDTLRGQYRERRTYKIVRLPPYVIMTMKRFTKNEFFMDKNPTIVNFPVKNLELRPFVAVEEWHRAVLGDKASIPEDLAALSVHDLKLLLRSLQASISNKALLPATDAIEKGDLIAAVKRGLGVSFGTKYNLVANVVHDSPPSTDKGSAAADPLLTGSYRVHVPLACAGQWYEIQDLLVQETQAQFIGVSESYIAIYERGELSVST